MLHDPSEYRYVLSRKTHALRTKRKNFQQKLQPEVGGRRSSGKSQGTKPIPQRFLESPTQSPAFQTRLRCKYLRISVGPHQYSRYYSYILPTDSAIGASKVEAYPRSLYSRKPKGFNLNTYKLHSLGDYADTIRQYGTTDSYSTQLVSNPLMRLQSGELINVSRVKYHIEIQKFRIHGLVRSNTRNRLLLLKEGAQDFDTSGRRFQSLKLLLWTIWKMLQLPSSIPMRLD